MPAIEASHRRTVIIMIEIVDQLIMSRIVWVAQIWCIIILFHSLAVHLLRKTPGASEIIFCSGSADGWIILVSIDVEFHLTFSVPVAFEAGQCKISSNVLAFPFDVVEDNVVFCLFRDALTTPLGMEIGSIFRNRCQAIETTINKY